MVINNYLPSAPKFGLIQTRMTWARIKLIVRILLLEKFLFKSKERMGDPLFGQIWIEQEKKFSRPMESMLNCRVDINPCSRSWSKASASQSCGCCNAWSRACRCPPPLQWSWCRPKPPPRNFWPRAPGHRPLQWTRPQGQKGAHHYGKILLWISSLDLMPLVTGLYSSLVSRMFITMLHCSYYCLYLYLRVPCYRVGFNFKFRSSKCWILINFPFTIYTHLACSCPFPPVHSDFTSYLYFLSSFKCWPGRACLTIWVLLYWGVGVDGDI